MHKREFERLAKALRAYRQYAQTSATWHDSHHDGNLYDAVVDQIALACQDCSGAGGFDYARFRTACGLED